MLLEELKDNVEIMVRKMENIKYNKYGFYSCSTTGANPCVKLIMLSFRSKVYQSIVVLTLYTTQASALCFKLLMLLKENT